jgi:hypothetical protein
MRALPITVTLVAALALGGCSEAPKGEKGDAGEKGESGPAGPPGPAGPVGASGTAIRFVDTECRQGCKVACEENERILGAYAINPGGAFIYESDSQATFRPQRQGIAIKVVLTCILK